MTKLFAIFGLALIIGAAATGAQAIGEGQGGDGNGLPTCCGD